MKDLLRQFLQHLRNRNVSPHTLTAYENDVATFLQFAARIRQKPLDALSPSDLDAFAIRSFLGELHKQRISAASSARKLSALRTFVRFLRREDLVDNDPAALVAAPKRGQTIPAHLTVAEMNRLLEMPDTSAPLGRRDRAILELFYASGLRLSELVGLDMEDVNLSGRMVRVMGKGRKERLVPFNTSTADALRAWLKDRTGKRGEGRKGIKPKALRCSSTIAAGGCRRAASIGWSGGMWRYAARNSGSARTRCAIRSRPICSRTAPICGPFRSCWAMRVSARRSATPT